MTRPLRVHYGPAKRTRAAAEALLEQLFACGEVSESEQPQIVRYGLGDPRPPKDAVYRVTLLA